MVTKALEIEIPRRMHGKRHALPRAFRPVLGLCDFFKGVRRAPLLVARNVPQDLLVRVRVDILLKNGFSLKDAMLVPHLSSGIIRLQLRKKLLVPVEGISAVRLRLDVIPPHIFLTLAVGPGRFTGHRTRLACDTPIDIKDESELPVRVALCVGVRYFATNLAIKNLVFKCVRHVLFPPQFGSSYAPPLQFGSEWSVCVQARGRSSPVSRSRHADGSSDGCR